MRCSVIVPLFNKAKFVGMTLRAALEQTHAPHEIIVVDDGSTDNGESMVRSFGDARIRLLRQTNAGVSSARNRGIAEATGELVAFLDADDWWHPQHLQTVIDIAYRYPRCDVFATRHRRIASEDFPGSGWDSALPTGEDVIEDCVPQWFRAPTFYTCSIAVRRSLATSLQPCFPPGENYGEDLDFLFRLNEHTSFVVSRACTCAYRVGLEDSLSKSWRVRQVAPFIKRLEERVRTGITPTQLQASRRRFAEKARINRARWALIEGYRFDAFRLLLDSVPSGLAHRSFWVAVVMLLLVPSSLILRWEQWRQKIPR